MARMKFLNTEIDNLTMKDAVSIAERMLKNKEKGFVVTPNVDHIVKLERDEELRNAYKHASLILTDGQPLIWISRFLSTPIREKISGSDFFPKVCEVASQNHQSLFLFGAAPGVAKLAGENLKKRFPGLHVVGSYSPDYGFEKSPEKVQKAIQVINDSHADLLAVGLGAPKQEKFIDKYYEQMNVSVILAIGASIDFEAGKIKRAPRWISQMGFEWLYRLVREPRRMFKRYLIDDMHIIPMVAKYKHYR